MSLANRNIFDPDYVAPSPFVLETRALGEELHWLFDPEAFLEDALERETLDAITGNYRHDCDNMCHNALGWMVLRSQQMGAIYGFDPAKFWWVYGSYQWQTFFGSMFQEHSWCVFEMDGQEYVLDLTLAQFEPSADPLFVGVVNDRYSESCRVCFTDQNGIMDLVLAVG
jgi:hypothetical protein